MEGFPAALIIASMDSVVRDNNVMYRLVQPLPDGSGVQSTDRLVNVVPYRRTYVFERKNEIDVFRNEILKRPLVLQPVLHFGRGLGKCGACYNDEHWVVMVNQTHPKILSRLQMGMDSAKAAIERGQSVEIKFRFGKLIERVYREHLKQKELGEAKEKGSSYDEFMAQFRFVEWEHADLTIRFHGYAAKLNRSTIYELHNLDMKWHFEDIGMHEMVWSQLHDQVFPKPHLAPVTEEEIRELLPAWTINGVSPLEEMGDAIPENNYSYAQAGRLYESFRKKRRHRNPPNAANRDVHSGPPSYNNVTSHEQEGAVGGDPEYPYDYSHHDYEGNEYYEIDREDDRDYHDESHSRPWRKYDPGSAAMNEDEYYYVGEHAAEENKRYPQKLGHYDSGEGSSHKGRVPVYNNLQQDDSSQDFSQPDKYGHIHANVQIKTAPPPPQKGKQLAAPKSHYDDHQYKNYDYQNTSSNDLYPKDFTLKKQDSDRSSRSTNADSGYCPEAEGERSRGGSYDFNDPSNAYKMKLDKRNRYDNLPLKTHAEPHNGLENPAFRDHEDEGVADEALRKHKDLVAKMLEQQRGAPRKSTNSSSSYGSHGPQSPYALSPKELGNGGMQISPTRQDYRVSTSGGPDQIAESFI